MTMTTTTTTTTTTRRTEARGTGHTVAGRSVRIVRGRSMRRPCSPNATPSRRRTWISSAPASPQSRGSLFQLGGSVWRLVGLLVCWFVGLWFDSFGWCGWCGWFREKQQTNAKQAEHACSAAQCGAFVGQCVVCPGRRRVESVVTADNRFPCVKHEQQQQLCVCASQRTHARAHGQTHAPIMKPTATWYPFSFLPCRPNTSLKRSSLSRGLKRTWSVSQYTPPYSSSACKQATNQRTNNKQVAISH